MHEHFRCRYIYIGLQCYTELGERIDCLHLLVCVCVMSNIRRENANGGGGGGVGCVGNYTNKNNVQDSRESPSI